MPQLGVVGIIGPFNFPAMVPLSFVGSTPIAQYIDEEAAKHGKRAQALGGARNHMLVLPDADLDLVADAATVVIDGRGIDVDGDADGFWLGPTLLDNVPTTSRAYQEEIFLPVLSIVRIQSFEEGVELINSGAFGNGTAIFTNDGGAAGFDFFTREKAITQRWLDSHGSLNLGLPEN